MRNLISQSVAKIAGNLATVLFVLAIVLQLLLAAGILPVSMAWGGQQEVLTIGLRISSVVAAAVLGIFTYIIRRRAGLLKRLPPSNATKVLSWVITGYLFFNTIGNFASVSQAERLLFGPISLFLAISCMLVSVSKSNA